MYDVREVRRDFPILDRRVGEMKLVYLDSAATSQETAAGAGHPQRVLRGAQHQHPPRCPPLGRGGHGPLRRVRERVARFLGAPDVGGLIFYPRHDRIHKPCRPRLGPQEPARRRRDLAHRGRAPLEPCTLAASGAYDRARSALHPPTGKPAPLDDGGGEPSDRS